MHSSVVLEPTVYFFVHWGGRSGHPLFHFSDLLFQLLKIIYSRTSTNAGHVSTTTTCLQRSLFYCPGGQSIHWLLFNPVHNGNGHYSASSNAKITSRQTANFFSATEVRNGYVIWSVWRVDDRGNRFDCVPFNNATVSKNCLQNL